MSNFTPRRSLSLHPLVAGLAIVLATGGMQSALAANVDNSARVRGSLIQAASPKAQEFFQQKMDRHAARPHATVDERPAATLAVTSCADDGSVGTLREVLGNVVSGDVVDLSALTCSSITLATGALEVAVDDLTLKGPGASALAIDGDAASVVVNHYGSGTLTVDDLTITNGSYYFSGAGMWIKGNLVLNRSTVSNNHVHTNMGYGGGIYARGSITLNNSTLQGNSAISDGDKYDSMGGGAYAEGDIIISGSSVIDNIAGDSLSNGFGGGVVAAGELHITDSTFSGNQAHVGGAGMTRPGGPAPTGVLPSGDITVINSTISSNSAVAYGGGLAAFGGLQLFNSTVTANSAGDSGGGGIVADGPSAVVQSSIVAGNTDTSSGVYAADFSSYSGVTVTGANNLITSSDTGVPADTLTTNPQLGALAANGGNTATHALAATSPAIDAGNNTAGLSFDQRGAGFARVAGAQADIGAFEAAAVAPPGPPAGGAVAIPTASTWTLAMLAGLLALVGWRRGRFNTRAR